MKTSLGGAGITLKNTFFGYSLVSPAGFVAGLIWAVRQA